MYVHSILYSYYVCVFFLVVVYAESPDIEVNRDGERVADLKRKVMQALNAYDKNVRLICCGKLLDPPSADLCSFSVIKQGAFVHAVVSAYSPTAGSGSGDSVTSENSNSNNNLESTNSNMGFNRLHTLGFSQEQIAAVRATFRAQVDELSSTVPRNEGESDQSHRERVEQRWMSSQGPYSDFSMNLPQESTLGGRSRMLILSSGFGGNMDEEFGETRVGTYRDFFWGFFMGFVLGFLMLFCVWDRHIPHRQRTGILLGVFMSIMLENSRAAANAAHGRMRGSQAMHEPQQPLDPSNPASVTGGAYNVGDGGDPLTDPPNIISLGT